MKNNIFGKKRGILISVIFIVLGVFGMQGERNSIGSNAIFLGDSIPHISFEE